MQINYSNPNAAKKFLLNITNALNCAEAILKPACSNLEVNVTFVGRWGIKKLNKKTRGINKVTDVLSYPNLLSEGCGIITKSITKKQFMFDINPQSGNIVLGDIVICLPRCYWQAKKYGNSFMREVCYLATHGLLHLFGFDHIVDADKVIMRQTEECVMAELGLSRD